MRNLVRWAVIGAVAVSGAGLAAVGCSSGGATGGGSGTDASDDGANGDSTTPDSGEDSSAVDASDTGAADSTTSDAADGGHADSSNGDASDAAVSDGASSEAAPDGGGGACQIFDASALDEAAVAAGFQQVFTVYKCQNCHQDRLVHPVDDAGNGIVLSGNNAGLSATTFPPNLTNDPTGLGCWSNQQVQDAILNGLDPEGGALCAPMPVFGHASASPGRPMDAGTAQEIIAFLRSLPAVANQVSETTCAAPADAGSDADAAGGDAAAGDAAGGDAGIADASDGGG